MITGKYRFQVCFDEYRLPTPALKEGVDNVELRPIDDAERAKRPPMPEIWHEVEFFEEDGVMKGIHETPRGKQRIDKVVYTEYSIAWDAYAGSEGVDLFHFCLGLNENTGSFAGVASGCAPFFRGFNLLLGEKLG